MQAPELMKRIQAGRAPAVLDVRTGLEFRQGHIPGAIHAPALKLLFKLDKFPSDKSAQLVITCEHGPRALTAQSILAAYGFRNTELLEGHMAGWKKAGLPLEK